jgi:hypothetical protein
VVLCRWRVKMAWSPQLDYRTEGARARGAILVLHLVQTQ